ncbi:radical SAM protein [Candidatus Bathyarchaeota archaeon]|nr:radical SAM protein [Candidatus Bathyarchaeota archaeon]
MEFTEERRYLSTLKAYVRSRLITHVPFVLAHSVTYGCNARCKMCTNWKMSHRVKEDLDTTEVKKLLEDAYSFGMRAYYAFGGEPLVRKDLPQVLNFSKTLGYLTMINTNGSTLGKLAPELAPNLDFAFISLDYPDDYHDVIRGRKGSFREVIDGISSLHKYGSTRITLVTTISRLNFDKMVPMAELADKLGVGISYNTVEPTVSTSFDEGRTDSPVGEYGLPPHQIRVFYRTLLQLKRQGYPLMETEKVLEDYCLGRKYKCLFPRIFLYVSPEGKIFSCTYDHTFDLRKASLSEYFSSELYRRHTRSAENCNICVRTCVRMYSYSYAPEPLHFLELFSSARHLVKQSAR